MKRALNVNIGSITFILEEDAYYTLKRYLEDLSIRIEAPLRNETMGDVEMRVADILSDFIVSSRHVVTVDHIRRVMEIIGNAEDLGEPSGTEEDYTRKHSGPTTPPPVNDTAAKKLLRSKDDRVIGGICGGLAKYGNVDSVLIRVAAILALIMSAGTFLFFYFVLWIVIPVEE